MEELFDKLARESATGMSRRKAFRRFGWGVAVAAFAAFGIKRVSADGCVPKCCETLCKSFDTPGKDRGQCIADCVRGENLLGTLCAQQCS
jgi:hypothetical protein